MAGIVAVLALSIVALNARAAFSQINLPYALTAPTTDAFVNLSDIPSSSTSESANVE